MKTAPLSRSGNTTALLLSAEKYSRSNNLKFKLRIWISARKRTRLTVRLLWNSVQDAREWQVRERAVLSAPSILSPYCWPWTLFCPMSHSYFSDFQCYPTHFFRQPKIKLTPVTRTLSIWQSKAQRTSPYGWIPDTSLHSRNIVWLSVPLPTLPKVKKVTEIPNFQVDKTLDFHCRSLHKPSKT